MTAVTFALVVAATVIAASPDEVAAHGGARVLRTESGPYHVEASVTREGSLIDESIRLTNATTHQLVLGAAVALTLEGASGERIGPILARPVGEVYEVRYQPRDGDGWNVLIEIQGPDGGATVRHPYRAPSDSGWSGRPGLLLNLLLIVLLVAAVVIVPRLGRGRRHAPADSTAARE
ncbi:MAG: hypothetical protein AB7R89_24965 [Dehalococcoidia bacterium]